MITIHVLNSFSLFLDIIRSCRKFTIGGDLSVKTKSLGCLKENENVLVVEKILNKLSIPSLIFFLIPSSLSHILKWDLKPKTLATARLACGDGLLGDRKESYPFLNSLTESASVIVAGRAFHSLTILLVNVFARCRHLVEAWPDISGIFQVGSCVGTIEGPACIYGPISK
ncbi:hypothetical protein BpHYR1_030139 [Brachionus plicatilis]|uniref:Uncharacterized protein n=1 Tax=Brachionus plicatilis TaxID=10195 RepID=A0A3M7RLZ9_BRAPC|nr:hypothetical protein BpHYR1_030139 [Brachionus plicatilis]